MHMDKNILLPSKPKEPKTFTISAENVEWMLKNIPEGKQSLFVDALVTRYRRRREAAKIAQAAQPAERIAS